MRKPQVAIEAFNSADDMHAFLAGSIERANSLTQPWQRKVTYGDYVVLYGDADASITYGYIPTVEQFSNEDPFNAERNYVYAKLYNAAYQPNGLYESVHISQFEVVITAQQFKQLKAARWPSSIYTMLRAMYGNQPLIFLFRRDNQVLFQRTTGHMMYCIVEQDSLSIIDEAELNQRFGILGWHMIDTFFIDDRGNGGQVIWDAESFR